MSEKWNIYFRKDENEDWQWQGSIPPLIVETFEKDGKTSPGDQWHHEDHPLDLSEGRAATLVIRNQRMGLESRYALEATNGARDREPSLIIFNCKLH